MTATIIEFDATLVASTATVMSATALIESELNPSTDPIHIADKFVTYTIGNRGYIVRIHSPPS